MTWKIRFTEVAEKQFSKLNKETQKRILKFLDKIEKIQNPRINGKALQGNARYKLWRYRVGDYRLICNIVDEELTILLVKIGHRKEVYDR